MHFGGMSVNGNTDLRRDYEPLLPGCFHIDSPWLVPQSVHRRRGRSSAASVADALDREIVFQGPDTVAAFIAEPIRAPAA